MKKKLQWRNKPPFGPQRPNLEKTKLIPKKATQSPDITVICKQDTTTRNATLELSTFSILFLWDSQFSLLFKLLGVGHSLVCGPKRSNTLTWASVCHIDKQHLDCSYDYYLPPSLSVSPSPTAAPSPDIPPETPRLANSKPFFKIYACLAVFFLEQLRVFNMINSF